MEEEKKQLIKKKNEYAKEIEGYIKQIINQKLIRLKRNHWQP